jgi:putative phosphoribosyl transferase
MKEVELPFADRRAAGRSLGALLMHHRGEPGPLVLALPRGGVAVGYEVALALDAPLDVYVVRKLGYPGHEEYALGAIATGGVRVLNEAAVPGVSLADLESVTAREQAELQRRERLYRGDRPPLAIAGRCVIVVDDGLATGSTMRAAALALRQKEPRHLCIAVPVGPRATCQELAEMADELVCGAMPEPFTAVGLWYRDFPQATDDEVRDLLARASVQQPGGAQPPNR